MTEDSSGTHRVPMTLPGAQYVIDVPKGDVEHRLEMGWKKVRSSRRADTGTVSVQRTDPR